jgi:hypothetical protein
MNWEHGTQRRGEPGPFLNPYPMGDPWIESLRHWVPSTIARDGGAASQDRAWLEGNSEEMATPLHIAGVQVKGLLKAEGGAMRRAGFRQVELNDESDKLGSSGGQNIACPRFWPDGETKRGKSADESLFLDGEDVNRLDDKLDRIADFEVKILD